MSVKNWRVYLIDPSHSRKQDQGKVFQGCARLIPQQRSTSAISVSDNFFIPCSVLLLSSCLHFVSAIKPQVLYILSKPSSYISDPISYLSVSFHFILIHLVALWNFKIHNAFIHFFTFKTVDSWGYKMSSSTSTERSGMWSLLSSLKWNSRVHSIPRWTVDNVLNIFLVINFQMHLEILVKLNHGSKLPYEPSHTKSKLKKQWNMQH